MVLTIINVDGTIECGLHCLSIEKHGSVLDVYFNYNQYLDNLPTTFDKVKSFTVYPEENDISAIENEIQKRIG